MLIAHDSAGAAREFIRSVCGIIVIDINDRFRKHLFPVRDNFLNRFGLIVTRDHYRNFIHFSSSFIYPATGCCSPLLSIILHRCSAVSVIYYQISVHRTAQLQHAFCFFRYRSSYCVNTACLLIFTTRRIIFFQKPTVPRSDPRSRCR